MRLLLLEKDEPANNQLLHLLMCHEDQRPKFPEYWDRFRNVLAPFIVDVLNNDSVVQENQPNSKISIDDVVSGIYFNVSQLPGESFY